MFDVNSGRSVLDGMVLNGLSQSISAYNNSNSPVNNPLINQGGSYVLNSIGINTNRLGMMGGGTSGIANIGMQAATQIAQSILTGNLNLQNLNMFSNFSTNSLLSSTSGIIGSIAGNFNMLSDLLGSSVSNSIMGGQFGNQFLTNDAFNALSNLGILNVPMIGNVLGSALGSIFGGNQQQGMFGTISSPASFAMQTEAFIPKFKYLYAVTITFNESNGGTASKGVNSSFTFLIKKFDRPKISIDHEEVNFYNFRSMVPKKTVYKPITLEIHDDIKSNTMNFLVGYLRRVSPLFNQSNPGAFELNGMNFSSSTSSYGLHSPSGNDVCIISKIELVHLYDYGRHKDVYVFHRPKITEFNMDELDMELGNINCQVSIEFTYDALNMKIGEKADGIQGSLEALYRFNGDGNADSGSVEDTKYTNLLTKPNGGTVNINEGSLSNLLGQNFNIPGISNIFDKLPIPKIPGIGDISAAIPPFSGSTNSSSLITYANNLPGESAISKYADNFLKKFA
jgi:hypothetical protein